LSDQKPDVKTILRRPIDCAPKLLQNFIDIVLIGGEVPVANLRRGVPSADMLFFAVLEKQIIGVSCLRYPNANFHKHLFEKAGVPEMYNPLSLEACWLCVKPEYRGVGAWSSIFKARTEYTEGRPTHALHRADNKLVSDPVKNMGYSQAGIDFYADTSDDKLCLIVKNHDPVFDPSKKMKYC